MSLSGENKSIRFPTHYYVGFVARENDVYPLGFQTPDGTDQAAQKRKATVDSWAARTKLPSRSYENKPLIGFKLAQTIRHGGGGWGQGSVKWRIHDPRGFELEITSNNLAQILAHTVIEEGEILQECMWARLGADNVLVPVESEVYKAAQTNTERQGKSVRPS